MTTAQEQVMYVLVDHDVWMQAHVYQAATL